MQQIGVAVVVVALIGSAAAYVLAGALNFTKRGGVSVVRKARLHLSLLGAAFFLLLAASAYLEVPHLLTDVTGPGIVPGASYTDVMARMPAARVLMVVAVLCAGARGVSRVFDRRVAGAARDRPVSPHLGRRVAVRGGDSALRRHAERAGGRNAVHDAQHRGDTAGVQSRRRADAQFLRRRRADARRHRPQRRHDQERAPLGSPAAARDLRPDSGAAHLLRLRVGRQRSLHDQRRAAAGDALGARAEFRKPAEPHVDQRAPDVHARLRHHARAGERGDAGRAADSVRQGHSAAVVGGRRHRRQGAEHLFRRADEQLRAGEHATRRNFTTRRPKAKRTSRPSTAAPTACASAASAAGCSSASASSRCRFCSATTSPPTAACCITGTSPTASRPSRRFCATTTTRIWWCRTTAGCSGFATPTRPPRDIRIRRRRPAASTTSATR